ncbi:hypothetical protein C8Q80DRAFT_163679 [Daedaleopsis nitida]|nr:hypothetical protein C8Q80DRAFT_163679 [Daedaleopsis nitida]
MVIIRMRSREVVRSKIGPTWSSSSSSEPEGSHWEHISPARDGARRACRVPVAESALVVVVVNGVRPRSTVEADRGSGSRITFTHRHCRRRRRHTPFTAITTPSPSPSASPHEGEARQGRGRYERQRSRSGVRRRDADHGRRNTDEGRRDGEDWRAPSCIASTWTPTASTRRRNLLPLASSNAPPAVTLVPATRPGSNVRAACQGPACLPGRMQRRAPRRVRVRRGSLGDWGPAPRARVSGIPGRRRFVRTTRVHMCHAMASCCSEDFAVLQPVGVRMRISSTSTGPGQCERRRGRTVCEKSERILGGQKECSSTLLKLCRGVAHGRWQGESDEALAGYGR